MRNGDNHLNIHNHHLPEPTEIKIPYAINLRGQQLKCPLCSYKSQCLKSPRFFIKHFKQTHKRYILRMIYSCSICELEIPENDKDVHLASHASRKIPFTPPTCIPSPPSPPSPPSTDTQSESQSPDSSNDPPSSPSLCIDETPRSPKSPSLDGSTTSPLPSPARLHSPELFSQEPKGLVERFLAECVEPPTNNSPQPNPAPTDEWELPAHQNLPLIGDVSTHCPSPATDATHLLPQSRTIATPSAAIPPLMANIVHTPDHNQPSTRQPTSPPPIPSTSQQQ